MGYIYAFAILWFTFNTYILYKSYMMENMTTAKEEEIYSELIDMRKMIAPAMLGKALIAMTLAIMVFDIAGFVLCYQYAYIVKITFYNRTILFFAFIVIFLLDQLLNIRHTFRCAAVLSVPDVKTEVLNRWLRINEHSMATIDRLGAIAKFTASLQLLLFTVGDKL